MTILLPFCERDAKFLGKYIFPGLFCLLAVLSAPGCGREAAGHHYLVATRVDSGQDSLMSMTVTLVRKFEKESWCAAERESLIKRGFDAECRYEDLTYEPMFQGEPAGRWYVQQRIGRFPPSVVIYEFNPPLPDDLVLRYLKQSAPHVLKFAAVHRAPAQVRIFSPGGEVV